MIDTGAMYRAIGLAAVRRGIDLHDAAALESLANATRIDFIPGERRACSSTARTSRS